MQSITEKILRRIRHKGRGYAFSGADFLDIASADSARKALSQASKSGKIRRVIRGIYDYPRVSEQLGELSPDYDQVAQAIARRNGSRIEPSGAWAANLLGLSSQVPGRIVYLTNGLSRDTRIGEHVIEFKRASPKQLVAKSRVSNLFVQALRHLGKERVDTRVIDQIGRRLNEEDRRTILKDTRYAAYWIYEVAKQVAQVGGDKDNG